MEFPFLRSTSMKLAIESESKALLLLDLQSRPPHQQRRQEENQRLSAARSRQTKPEGIESNLGKSIGLGHFIELESST
jgi:hypothetical protein